MLFNACFGAMTATNQQRLRIQRQSLHKMKSFCRLSSENIRYLSTTYNLDPNDLFLFYTINFRNDPYEYLGTIFGYDKSTIKMLYIETPSNPTNDLFDIKGFVRLRDLLNDLYDSNVKLVVDNTYMGPVWQHPLRLGADLTVYSATKYLASEPIISLNTFSNSINF